MFILFLPGFPQTNSSGESCMRFQQLLLTCELKGFRPLLSQLLLVLLLFIVATIVGVTGGTWSAQCELFIASF